MTNDPNWKNRTLWTGDNDGQMRLGLRQGAATVGQVLERIRSESRSEAEIEHVVRPTADRAAMRGPERGGGIER